MNQSLIFTLLLIIIVAASSSSVLANWRGPYDTHDEHSLWLRKQMEKTPRKDFIIENEADGFSIIDFGAVPTVNTVEAAIQNGEAFFAATVAANASSSGAKSRFVLVPAGFNFWIMPSSKSFINLKNVTFQFNGNLSCSNINMSAWPELDGVESSSSDSIGSRGTKIPLIYPQYSSDLTFVGNGGAINGNGYPWWVAEYNRSSYNAPRPNMIQFNNVVRVVIDSLSLFNSPRYHVYLCPAFGVLIQHLTISVSVFDQYNLQKRFGTMLHEAVDMPTFPLNTDGIDIRGNTIVVRHCTVLNFDDSYCPKPLGMNGPFGCTNNILIQDSTQILGVGNSIGSVPPTSSVNCVQNVTFDRMTFKYPLKAIYVKPNPGNSGYGLIQNITYSNSHAQSPVWWSIFVSTQQQDQPGGSSNTGCSFLYPLPGQNCPTQPRVPVKSLFLSNMTFDDALLSPGIMRCNDTYEGPLSGPCSGWEWNNVKVTSILKWPFGENFLCHALDKPIFNNVYPSCISNVPTSAPSSSVSAKKGELLASLFERRQKDSSAKNIHHHDLNDEAKEMLDQLGMMMKERGISLWNIMKKLNLA